MLWSMTQKMSSGLMTKVATFGLWASFCTCCSPDLRPLSGNVVRPVVGMKAKLVPDAKKIYRMPSIMELLVFRRSLGLALVVTQKFSFWVCYHETRVEGHPLSNETLFYLNCLGGSYFPFTDKFCLILGWLDVRVQKKLWSRHVSYKSNRVLWSWMSLSTGQCLSTAVSIWNLRRRNGSNYEWWIGGRWI